MQPKITPEGEKAKASIAAARAAKNASQARTLQSPKQSGNPVPPTNGMSSGLSSSLLAEIEKRMIGSGSGVSSRDSGIQATVDKALKAQEDLRVSTEERIQSDYEYEKEFMLSGAESDFRTSQESSRGFGTQLAALNKLTEQTNKNLRDLDQRKQDALAANDAKTAAQIADIELKAIEFQQQSEQQFYSNAFSLMGLDLQAQAQDRASQEFLAKMEFDKEQRIIDRQDNMASLAAEYGVEMTPEDTYETLSVKIAAIADEERRISAAKALDGLKSQEGDLVYDDILSSSIAKGSTAQDAALAVVRTMREAGQLLSREEYNKVYARAVELYSEYSKTKARNQAEQGGSFISRFFGSQSPMSPSQFPLNVRSNVPVNPKEVALNAFFGNPDGKIY